jgi:8-oxo-dGTP pyrophosphatase MutT (NUDIX family)
MGTFESTESRENVVTDDHRYSVSVAGVIVDDEGRALIIQRRDNGHWEPPGGILEHGETIEDGLRREVYEETGLKVEPGPLTGVYQNMRRNIVALVFRCRRSGGELTDGDEVSAFRWVSADEVRTLMTEAYAIRVLDSLADSGRPVVRVHDGTNLL